MRTNYTDLDEVGEVDDGDPQSPAGGGGDNCSDSEDDTLYNAHPGSKPYRLTTSATNNRTLHQTIKKIHKKINIFRNDHSFEQNIKETSYSMSITFAFFICDVIKRWSAMISTIHNK